MIIDGAESFKMWAEDESMYGPVDIGTLEEWIQDDRVFPERTTMARRVADDNKRLYQEVTSQFVWG